MEFEMKDRKKHSVADFRKSDQKETLEDWTDDDLLEIKKKIIRKLGLKEDDPHDDGRRENG
jgi:hypothetical protein